MEGLAGLFITVVSSVVLGITFLLILYKTVDGDFPLAAGLAAMVIDLVLLMEAVRPVNPIVPGIILITTVTIVALWPYASTQLELAELRAIDTEKLERSYAALVARPDNIAAIFEVATQLHAHGMKGHAVGLATKTLDALSLSVNEVTNRSLRDQFRSEESQVKRWIREIAKNPVEGRPVACPHCGFVNEVTEIVCAKCGEAYVLSVARSLDVRKRFIGKLLISAAAIAALVVGASAIGLYLGGAVQVVAFLLAILGTGLLINFLFRPPTVRRS